MNRHAQSSTNQRDPKSPWGLPAVVLVHPQIAPNTGNVIRLCANTGAALHLVEPLGFSLHHAGLKRAGLDYHDLAPVCVHPCLSVCLASLGADRSVFALSIRGQRLYTDVTFSPSDILLFGSETQGLPSVMLDSLAPDHVLRLPMQPGTRCLNLSNVVAVVVMEAWRQQGFCLPDG